MVSSAIPLKPANDWVISYLPRTQKNTHPKLLSKRRRSLNVLVTMSWGLQRKKANHRIQNWDWGAGRTSPQITTELRAFTQKKTTELIDIGGWIEENVTRAIRNWMREHHLKSMRWPFNASNHNASYEIMNIQVGPTSTDPRVVHTISFAAKT